MKPVFGGFEMQQKFIKFGLRVHNLKYVRSTTSGFKDIGITKSEYVAKTQLLWGKGLNELRNIHVVT